MSVKKDPIFYYRPVIPSQTETQRHPRISTCYLSKEEPKAHKLKQITGTALQKHPPPTAAILLPPMGDAAQSSLSMTLNIYIYTHPSTEMFSASRYSHLYISLCSC